MRLTRFGALAVLLAISAMVLSPGGAAALEEHARSGFFIGFGLGGGNASWDWDYEGDSPSEGSGVGHFRIGGALRDDLLLGYEGSAWVKEYDVEAGGDDIGTATLSFSASTFAATWFPGNMGWFLRGGLGFATASAEVSVDGPGSATTTVEETENGFAVIGATGYEWRFTRKFAFGPAVELFYLGVDNEAVQNVIVVDGTLEFTWYW